MCGINGFNFSDEKLILQMNKSIHHRGPDDSGYFLDKGISFGHNRLSIIDLSVKGHQPMFSRDGRYVIIYNGELYNFVEIKKDLENKGIKFISASDTEVILSAFIVYGIGCLQKFNGIFSFAIWDKKEDRLFAARDPFGIKPFFYYYQNNQLIFSSEIKSILTHNNIDKELDYESLNVYFRFLYIPGPQTIFKNIKKLLPGHYLIWQNNKLEIKKYYDVSTVKKDYSFQEAKQLIRDGFDQAVKRQLVSDRPLGLFLSGGIDSTAILGSMSRLVNHKIKTFTVKFDVDAEEEKFNIDSKLAKQNSQYYNTDHHELLLTARDVKDNLEKVVYHMDDLVSNHTQVATYLLAQQAKQDVAVVLGGDGADEIFGGYSRYYYYNLVNNFQKIPKFLRKNIFVNNLARVVNKQEIYRKLNSDTAFDLFWQLNAQSEKNINKFFKPDFNNVSQAKNLWQKYYFSNSSSNFLDQLMQIDLKSWLVDESLIKTDKLTMAHGLEARVPILDKDLVELALSIPHKYKINSKNQGKYIFKEAVRDYLPDYLYSKPKTGWFSPAAKWLRTGLKDMAYEVLSENYNVNTKDMFDFKAIQNILDNHISKQDYALNTIWPLINFQIWYKLFK